MRVDFSPELHKALQEYEEAFFTAYPLERDNLGMPAANVAEIRRRINENDPAPPMTEEEEERFY